MSTPQNDWLYDRARELIDAGISVGDAQDLNAGLNDLDALYETIKRLESKYLGETTKDINVLYKAPIRPVNAPDDDMWPEECV